MSQSKRKTLHENASGNLVVDEMSDAAHRHNQVFSRNKKLKPYISKRAHVGSNKYKIPERVGYKITEDGGVMSYRSRTGKGARASVNNANRSLKKGVRQESKKIILENLNEPNELD